MPVFGKGRKGKKIREKFLGKEVISAPKRVFWFKQIWSTENTSLEVIRTFFPLVLGRGKKDFVSKCFSETGKPTRVLDWGCGNGSAAEQLAKEYGKKALVYGYSKDSYNEWRYLKRAKIIHATKEDLFRYLKKIGPLDLVYSYNGLKHLHYDAVFYIKQLLSFVRQGGKIVLNGGATICPVGLFRQELAGIAKVYSAKNVLYITKL